MTKQENEEYRKVEIEKGGYEGWISTTNRRIRNVEKWIYRKKKS